MKTKALQAWRFVRRIVVGVLWVPAFVVGWPLLLLVSLLVGIFGELRDLWRECA